MCNNEIKFMLPYSSGFTTYNYRYRPEFQTIRIVLFLCLRFTYNQVFLRKRNKILHSQGWWRRWCQGWPLYSVVKFRLDVKKKNYMVLLLLAKTCKLCKTPCIKYCGVRCAYVYVLKIWVICLKRIPVN